MRFVARQWSCATSFYLATPIIMKTQDRILNATIECWADGRPFTTYSIASLTAGIGKGSPVAAKTVSDHLARWALDGRAELQPNRLRQGETAWKLLLGPDDATLRSVVEHAMESFPDKELRRLATALRAYLGLEGQDRDRARLLEAAADISADQLHGLPDRVAEAAWEAGLADTTVFPRRSTVKRALISAAMAGVIPVIFPRHHAEDPWEAACHRWFYHPNEDGTKLTTRQTYASNLLCFRDKLTELLPESGPSDLDRDDLEDRLFPELLARGGSPPHMRGVRTALRYVGRVHGEGPYAELEGTARGVQTNGYLPLPRGKTECFETLLTALGEAGFHDDVIEFLRWYRDFSLLPDHELWERDEEFPGRSPRRELSLNTWRQRILALRAHAFQILKLSESGDWPLTLEHVFGHRGVQALRSLETWWRERHARGEVASATSQGLQALLLAVGMVARGAYERALHGQGIDIVTAKEKPLDSTDLLSHTGDLGAAERGYLKLYLHTRARADRFQAVRARARSGHRGTDLKDIHRLFRKTPPSFWMGINRHLQSQVRNWSGTRGIRFHSLVQTTFLHGFLLSTGCRLSETAWIRLCRDGGYGPEEREQRLVHFFAWTRKNSRVQSAYLREGLVPEWLERLYLEESRPFIIARGVERGTLGEEHDFLFPVPATGRSMSGGWLPSSADDEKHANSFPRKAVSAFRGRWQSTVCRAASELGLEWPLDYGENTPHAIRTAMGYAIWRKHGLAAAADYLGDDPQTVDRFYASVEGIHVDASDLESDEVSALAISRGSPGRTGDVPDGAAEAGSSAEQIRKLQEENQALRKSLETLLHGGVAPPA